MQILAYVIALVIPLLSLYLIYRLDAYKTGQFRLVIGSFAAGVIGLLLATQINKAVIAAGLPRPLMVRFSAPVVEEILKGLLLLYLVRRADFTYFVEGAIYGFAAGIGFAVVENFQYVLSSGSAGLAVAISRVISSNLMHAGATAMLGIFLGWARFRPGLSRLLTSLAGLLTAMLLHIAFNNMVSLYKSGLVVLFAAAVGLGSVGLIVFAIKRGLQEEKIALLEKLNMADRVTRQEAAAVQNIEKVNIILNPISERFGAKKAKQVKDFLILQARIGLLRKSLDTLSDERMKKSVAAQLEKLGAEMDAARRQVGAYAMLYLRGALPEAENAIWGRLETLIQEKAAARPASGGINVWANLQTRQQEKAVSTQKSEPEQ